MAHRDAFWKLEHLSDAQLLESLSSVLRMQHRTLAALVAHLAEVEERRLHLEAAYSSMFAYCVRRLGMSKDEACRLERDGLGCSWVDAQGIRCGSRAWLELDHRRPQGKGGSSEPDNVRLLCRAHNQLEAERSYGRTHIEPAARVSGSLRRRASAILQPTPTGATTRSAVAVPNRSDLTEEYAAAIDVKVEIYAALGARVERQHLVATATQVRNDALHDRQQCEEGTQQVIWRDETGPVASLWLSLRRAPDGSQIRRRAPKILLGRRPQLAFERGQEAF